MAALDISNDIATYLEAKGEGAQGTNIFTDTQPDEPDNSVTVFDMGGNDPQEPPENWRELYIQVRCKNHKEGYERIWRLLNYILYPDADNGLITIGSNHYTAQLREIPSIYDRDSRNRYLFGFRVAVFRIDGNVSDTWLVALANWTKNILGTSWTVYSGLPGNQRPCIIWQLAQVNVSAEAGASFKVQKRFLARILGNTPDEQMVGSIRIVEGLQTAIKLALNETNKKYLLVENPSADYRSDAMTISTVSVVLSRRTSRPTEDVPLIAEVQAQGTLGGG